MSDLLGTFVTVTIPREAIPDDYDQVSGTITGIGGPLVQITTDSGHVFYRHKDKHLNL